MDKEKVLDQIMSNYQYFSALYNIKSLLSSIKEQQKRVDTQISQTQQNIKNYNDLRQTLSNQSVSPDQIKLEAKTSDTNIFTLFTALVILGVIGFIAAFVIIGVLVFIPGVNKIFNLFGGWPVTILFFVIIGVFIWWGIRNYMIEVSNNHRAIDAVESKKRSKADKMNQEFKQQAINIQKEIQIANDKVKTLLNDKAYFKDTLLPQTEDRLKQLEADKPDLINMPMQYKGNLKFLVALYDVLNTDQATSLGEGIKIVQDRFLNKDLTKAITDQIKQSQVALQQTINEKAKDITVSVNGLHNSFLQKANEINENVIQTNKRITTVGHNMTANLTALNANVVGYGAAATKALEDVNLSNQRLSKQVANLRLITYNS